MNGKNQKGYVDEYNLGSFGNLISKKIQKPRSNADSKIVSKKGICESLFKDYIEFPGNVLSSGLRANPRLSAPSLLSGVC